jgi:AcrR family transcriptional regulator
MRPRERSRNDFVDAAIKIVDEKGLDALTLRRLGDEVGVSFTSVYTYFSSREALVAALVEYVATEAINGVAEFEGSSRDQLVAIALSVRSSLSRHPRLAQAFMTSTNATTSSNAATLAVVSILQIAGLSGSELVSAYRVLESYVIGVTVFDLGAAPHHLEIRQSRYRDVLLREFAAVAKSEQAVQSHNNQSFLKGLNILLDGLGV